MKINDLILLASSAYPDGLIEQQWNFRKQIPDEGDTGDTLALFIARELADTFDKDASTKDQLIEALRVMDRARDQLAEVGFAVAGHLDKLNRKKGK